MFGSVVVQVEHADGDGMHSWTNDLSSRLGISAELDFKETTVDSPVLVSGMHLKV